MSGMYLMVDQAARARPRIAYIRVSLISSSVAPACFAAAKRPGTQEVQPAAAIAASATRSHRLRIQRAFAVVQPGELLHFLGHRRPPVREVPPLYVLPRIPSPAAQGLAGFGPSQLALDDGRYGKKMAW